MQPGELWDKPVLFAMSCAIALHLSRLPSPAGPRRPVRPVRIGLREICRDDGVSGADAGTEAARKVADKELHHQAGSLAADHRRVVAAGLPAISCATRIKHFSFRAVSGVLYRGREASEETQEAEEAEEAEEVGKPPERGLEKRAVTADPGVNAWVRGKEKTHGTESVPWLHHSGAVYYTPTVKTG